MNYDLPTIRELIKEALTTAEFNALFLDNFPSVYAETEGQLLPDRRIKLVDYANRQRKIPELLEAIQKYNPKVYEEFKNRLEQETNDSVIAELRQEPFIQKPSKLDVEELKTLFGHFSPRNLAQMLTAFLGAFKSVYGDFWTVRPDNPSLDKLAQIQELLKVYDNLNLAVRFGDRALVELQQANGGEDYTFLKTWSDRIAEIPGVQREEHSSVNPTDKHGYLLIALKESGRVTQGNPSVSVFAGLNVTGESGPIEFDAPSVTCSLKEVADHLSKLIRKAEEALIPYECGKVTIELFLPCIHIEENVAAWEVQNEQDRPRQLGMHRGFVVRSFERILNRTTQGVLKSNWQKLIDSVEAKNAYGQFYPQKDCPVPGVLEALLENVLGLMLGAELSADPTERQEIFYDIINSAVPIALWFCDTSDSTVEARMTEFDKLIRESCLTNFSDLAQRWRIRRTQPDSAAIKHLRLLCDCPDRWPNNVPDPRRDEDLLIAS